jgi:phosphatidylinositol alpha-1,6-mannosyltransferase
MAPARLLALTPTVSPDTGWGQYAEAVLNKVRDRYDVTVVTDLGDPIEIRSNPAALFGRAWQVRQRLEAVDAVLSLVAYPYSAIAYLATRLKGTPYFVTCHGTYAVEPLHDARHRPLAKRALESADGLFTVSNFTADRIREAGISRASITIVPNGVAPLSSSPEPFHLDHRVLLTVGAFKRRKGQQLAVRSFGEIADAVPDVHHHLVGSGVENDYCERVREVVQEYGLEDRIHVEGKVPSEELERWYATASVFVLTPCYVKHHFEGFGLVYLEANRHGVPVVGTLGTGAENAISHGRSGLCVAHEMGPVSNALQTLLTDDERQRVLSTGAKEWAAEHAWDRVVRRMCRDIDAAL